jgi:hypothetical protein
MSSCSESNRALTTSGRWLYTQFIATDANFRAGLKDRGIRDIELAPGWAYFVEEHRFQAHIKNHLDQKEVSY